MDYTGYFRAVGLLAIVLMVAVISSGCAEIADTVRHSEKDERFQVAEAALRYMMVKSSKSDSGKISSYVLEDGEYTDRLVKAFEGFQPLVVSGTQVNTAGPEALDVTGKRVKTWSVDVVDVRQERAAASVKWYSGTLEAGSSSLLLRRNDGIWTVELETLEMAS